MTEKTRPTQENDHHGSQRKKAEEIEFRVDLSGRWAASRTVWAKSAEDALDTATSQVADHDLRTELVADRGHVLEQPGDHLHLEMTAW